MKIYYAIGCVIDGVEITEENQKAYLHPQSDKHERLDNLVLNDIDFSYADLRGLSFDKSFLENVYFNYADLRGVSFCDVETCNISMLFADSDENTRAENTKSYAKIYMSIDKKEDSPILVHPMQTAPKL
jgi:uncharacterized protein YjbI with pentapeptide repeats